ncbi:MAG: ATP-binding cassette domain-containing protein [Sedimentisphaerales bacterium]|nr:ATP-binding cassette domain-containing protein [Sedimentisphaerales bacterium]
MEAFRRVFKYVWPQWPTLIVIFSTALVVGLLFSFSIATVLPLLKVMMGEEGLHGWINRKIAEDRYGIRFYVADRSELLDPNNVEIAYYLRISDVEEDGQAQKAGIIRDDVILGAGAAIEDKVPSSILLSELANAKTKTLVTLRCRRINEAGNMVPKMFEVRAGRKPFYAGSAQWVLKFIPQGETRENTRTAVMLIIMLMLITTAVRCAATFCQVYAVQKLMNNAMAQLREDTFKHALEIPAGFFDSEGANDTVSRLIRDTASIGTGIKILLGKTLREPLKALSLMAVALWIEPKLTLIFMCGAPMALYAIGKLGKKIKRATKKSLAIWAQILGKLKEALDAIKVIKVYNQQPYECSTFRTTNHRLLRQQLRIAKIDALTSPLMEVLGMIAGCVGLMFGAHWVFKGDMLPSDFFTLLILLGGTAESVRKVSDVWNKLQQANAGAERVYAIIDEKPEIESPDAFDLEPLRNKIEFKDIVFSYPTSESPVLKKINLAVEAGHNVAIVGPNGSGKTTLANLIPRLYEPQSGQILIDGKDIAKATLFSLRDQIGLVTQNVTTFNDTISANIAYGSKNATTEEIIAAAKRSFAHEFIAPLPNGYDTVIGEQGAGLSGGQLQRIVIARAILKNPAILIFDEATSQVDADSEAKIHKAIEEIMQDRTSFIIAHRFSTVISADIIVVMDHGRIIAQGQHEKLIKKCSLYQSLYETQLVKG